MEFVRIALLATLLLVAVAVAACNSGSSSMNPTGPSSTSMQPNSTNNAGGMAGLGPGGMQVASEFSYLVEMIPHHEEAITTATLLYRGTQRTDMRNFAAAIIETQSAEVRQMNAWLQAWYPGRDTHVDYQPMMRALTGLSGDALDRAFLEDMIPHHMMAVMMSQQLVMRNLANHAEVVPFATNIRNTQQSEIQTMAGWLRDWFGVTPGMGHGGMGNASAPGVSPRAPSSV